MDRRNGQTHCVRPLEDWGKLIGDVPSATAILDRFLHHAEVLTFSGKSYRLRNQSAPTPTSEDESKGANAPTGSVPKKRSKTTPPETGTAGPETDPTCKT